MSYPYGQCTYYADSTNPWIQGLQLGDAKDWLANAAGNGLSTGTAPIVGSIAAFEPGAPGLSISPEGHVADVVAVDDQAGTVTIRDMNWNYEVGVVQTHDVPMSSVSGYIYPPGTTSDQLSQAALTSTPATGVTPTGWSFGPFNQNSPGIGGIGDVVQGIGSVPGDIAKTVANAVGGFITAGAKGFEIFLGSAFIVAGLYVLITHTKTGGSAITVAKQTAKKAAELGAMAA